MKLRNIIFFTAWTLIVATTSSFLTHTLSRIFMNQKIHTLESPLLLDGSSKTGHNYLLPTGTTLYYDKAFPEGFISYRIYVNVEGIDLPSTTLSDPTEIRPITAYPVDKASLLKLIREYPLTKEDLASILKSKYLSKEEILTILSEYSR